MRQLWKESLSSLQWAYLTCGSGIHHYVYVRSMGCTQPMMTDCGNDTKIGQFVGDTGLFWWVTDLRTPHQLHWKFISSTVLLLDFTYSTFIPTLFAPHGSDLYQSMVTLLGFLGFNPFSFTGVSPNKSLVTLISSWILLLQSLD